jgi:hypothetical protein
MKRDYNSPSRIQALFIYTSLTPLSLSSDGAVNVRAVLLRLAGAESPAGSDKPVQVVVSKDSELNFVGV